MALPLLVQSPQTLTLPLAPAIPPFPLPCPRRCWTCLALPQPKRHAPLSTSALQPFTQTPPRHTHPPTHTHFILEPLLPLQVLDLSHAASANDMRPSDLCSLYFTPQPQTGTLALFDCALQVLDLSHAASANDMRPSRLSVMVGACRTFIR
jgi:hypothetical protein